MTAVKRHMTVVKGRFTLVKGHMTAVKGRLTAVKRLMTAVKGRYCDVTYISPRHISSVVPSPHETFLAVCCMPFTYG